MKKILLFISLFIFVLSLNSCSDDDVENIDDTPLSGEWQFGYLEIDGVQQDSPVCRAYDRITVNTNNKTAVWKTSDDDKVPCDITTYNLTYTINGKTLTISDASSVINLSVDNFTDKLLVIKGADWTSYYVRPE